jgi:hypothetical protein
MNITLEISTDSLHFATELEKTMREMGIGDAYEIEKKSTYHLIKIMGDAVIIFQIIVFISRNFTSYQFTIKNIY